MRILVLFLLLPLNLFAEFEATAVIQINPNMIAIAPSRFNKNYMAKELQRPLASEILRDALLLLRPEEAKDQPIPEKEVAELRKKISTKPRRGTDFIEITAVAETRNEAIKLSDAVSRAFIEKRRKEAISRAQASLKALDDELVAQSNLVQENRKELTDLIQKHGIPYFEEGGNPLGVTEQKMLEMARQKLADFEIQSDLVELSIMKLDALKGDQLILYVAGLDLPGNTIAEAYEQYQKARTKKLALFDKGHQPTDWEVLAINQQIKKWDDQIQKDLSSLKENLNTKLTLIKKQIEKLERLRKEKEGGLIDLSLRQSQYNQAKEAYEQSREMLREMKIRQQEARVLLERPRQPVTLHEKAR